MTDHAITITGQNTVDWAPWTRNPAPLGAQEVAGETVASLLSPGTELACLARPCDRPWIPGYAAVFRVREVGAGVTGLAVGDLAFCQGNHVPWQRHHLDNVIALPAGLDPAVAVFTRLMGVSWSTLTGTAARPADAVLITGLGPVGNLAAQIFRAAGYTVAAVDPDPARRALAATHGIPGSEAPPSPPGDGFQLAVECSGHEQAALDCCRLVRKGGEVALVGVPWAKRAPDLAAFDLLHAVFHRYVVLRSGWEWDVPNLPREFTIGSRRANLAAGLRWLAEGRVRVDGLASRHRPGDCATVYGDLAARRAPAPTAVFDWAAG